jgi:hypothetical protein
MKKITFILFALFTCWQINAQVTSYAFSQSNGTYTALSAPTILASQTATSGTSAGALDDVNYTLALPFNFNFAGVNYTSGTNIFVNSNGFVSFGATAPTAGTYGPIGSTNVYNGALSAFGLDANGGYGALGSNTTGSAVITITSGNTSEFTVGALISGTGVPVGSTVVSVNATQVTISANCTSTGTGRTFHVATGQISYGVEGVSPNRKLIVQYTNLRPYNVTQRNLDFQIVLNETSNVIDFIYGSSISGTTSSAPQVGLRGSANTSYINRTSTTSWSSTTAGTTNTQTITFLDTVLPASGLTFTWSPPSCSAPGGFVASAVTPTTATVSWNAASPVPTTGYEYYYSNVNTAPSGAGTATTNLTENLTGLSVNTTYYVWLRSDCGGGTFSAWAGPFTFATPCNPFSVPYFEGFESGYTHNTTVAGCLSQSSVTGAGVWTANSTFTDYNRTPRTGSFNAFLVYSNEDWMYIPIQLVGGTSYRVSFYARQDGATSTDSNMAVSYGSANNAAAMTNSIVTATGIINGNYQEIVGDFTPVTSGTYYVGIKGFMNATPWYISLDDISITVSPSCLNPSAIVASNITSNTVDLSWTDGSGGLQFDYEYAIQAPGTGIPTGAGAPIGAVTVLGEGFDINGNPLTANTLYEVYVRADCGGGSFSTWSGPITFRTLCSTFVAPFNQPFASNTFPSCWSQSGPTPWEFGSNVTTPAGFADYGADLAPDFNGAGGTFIGMDGSDNTNGEISVLLSPFIDVTPLTTPRLKYAVFGNNTNDAARNLLQVEVWNGTSWNLVNTVSDNLGTNWVVFTTNLSTLTITGPIQIRFTVTGVANGGSTFYHDILIDDVTVEETPSTAPACASNIVATPNASCGNFSNTITWDATSGANGYYLTIGTTSGGTDVLNNSDIGSTVSYSFTGTIGTTYFYKLVPYNAIGSATGCTEQSFTTNASGCYCVSAPTSVDGTGITNVQLVATNFANTVSTAPVYNDHTATVVDMSQGISNSVQITFNTDSFGTSYDYNTVIWIDVNDNFTFEPSEIVFTGVSAAVSPTILNASFVMPGTAPLGQHRMRIVATDALQTPANPCYSGSYGETADFTVNVVAATCTPPAATTSIVPACGTTQFSIDVNVTALGSGTPSISDGTTTWPVAAIGVVNVGPFASGSSVSLTLLHGSDVTCNLPLGTFTYVCPPVNDDCANAISVLTMPYSNTQDASAATGPIVSTCTGMNDGVWYTVVGNGGDIIIDVTAVTGWDPELGVYTGSCGTFTCVASIDNGGTSAGETYTIVASTLGTTYYINVGHYSGFGDSPEGPFTIGVTTTLSSGSFDNANFSAYPNPVKDVLNISYTSEISSVRVINMIGQEVLSKNINATSSQVDMSQLSAGTYIVNVTVGDAIKTLKVVKQ